MSKVVFEEKTIYNAVSKDLRIVSISDIHDDCKLKRVELYKKVLELIKKIQPQYICLVGDLLEKSGNEVKNLEEFVKCLGEVAPTILSLGNHDVYNKNGKSKFISKYHELSKYNGVYPLDNSLYEDAFVRIIGITPRKEEFMKKYRSDYERMYQEDYSSIGVKFDSSKYNIILSHNPDSFDSNIINMDESLQYVNLFLGGHKHNGCTPEFVCSIFDRISFLRNVGIFMLGVHDGNFLEKFRLFSKNVRGVKELGGGYLSINKGLRKVTIDNYFFDFIDNLYNNDFEVINVKKRR